MEKFKVGDKVLVEVEIVGEDALTKEYQLKPMTNTWTFWAKKDRIHQLIVNEANTLTKTYEDGLAEAWELAYKIAGLQKNGAMSMQDTLEIFGTEYAGDRDEILHDFTVRKAIEKIKTWEDAKEIRVGDIVLSDDSLTGVVSSIRTKSAYVLWSDGSVGYRYIDVLKKTGRQIDVAGLLAEIGGTT